MKRKYLEKFEARAKGFINSGLFETLKSFEKEGMKIDPTNVSTDYFHAWVSPKRKAKKLVSVLKNAYPQHYIVLVEDLLLICFDFHSNIRGLG